MNKKDICSIPGCGKEVVVSGMCSACYSGWNRIRMLTAQEFSHRVWKYNRLINRMGAVSNNMNR